jgi:hypothetical protein
MALLTITPLTIQVEGILREELVKKLRKQGVSNPHS